MKRKRNSHEGHPHKRLKSSPTIPNPHQATRQSRVLNSCYPSVLALREFLRARLPQKSFRRKKLNASLGEQADVVLDTWKVGLRVDPSPEVQRARSTEFVAFTQTQLRQSLTHTHRTQTCSVEDVLSFVVWHLFKNCSKEAFHRPNNVLCNGMQKGIDHEGSLIAPGVVQVHPNESFSLLKSPAWTLIFAALGADGHAIVASLLLDCGVFALLNGGEDNYYQISGTPINNLKSDTKRLDVLVDENARKTAPEGPSAIALVRNRMLYARPSINAKGSVRFGLKHIHVLQRYSNVNDGSETVHFLKHLFPRQFDLHNVFTYKVDRRTTAQPLSDYIYREDEIKAQSKHPPTWLPRRLRGPILKLAASIRRRHKGCAYTQKLRHYCALGLTDHDEKAPVGEETTISQNSSTVFVTQVLLSRQAKLQCPLQPAKVKHEQSFLAYATPTMSVVAFCKSVILTLLPPSAFGVDIDGKHNWRCLLNHVETFVQMRRFETTTLHHLCQGLRLNSLTWLVPPGMPQNQRISVQERIKRLQLLWEFMYYLYDSILIPLIQANFYVTEAGTQRNRLFYFRHDVWRKLAEPSLHVLRTGIYEQLQPAQVKQMLNDRALGYSNVRLLPKNEGARTITNLRRRTISMVKGRRILSPSINVQLAPVFGALSSERVSDPDRLGGAILSISGLHDRLKSFKKLVLPGSPLYFAKVDVQSCFDSIPQQRLLAIIQDVLASPAYRTSKYVEIRAATDNLTRPRYVSVAAPANDNAVVSLRKADIIATDKTGRVISEIGNQRVWSIKRLLDLLHQHVQNNVVKIGKKHYRQREGIPQGQYFQVYCVAFSTPLLNTSNSPSSTQPRVYLYA
ncbi:Telomerase reverse transcriptase [Cyphellophora attinorum]|uniref:Telomerase reverse transcriptase n=1 Tax=Cyphellophora attinorum TaxID=1664694 RepID=A0A0N0NS66_9EURO|nr:Telomerase reverse transcriptase [Phialophora attinorum]KPI45901.1 Telomerase reverse transcriptase [Phialophora attinorum]